MTSYLIRRVIQMVIVTFLVAVATYWLFSISPGGPLNGIRQQQRRITVEDFARLRAKYELDLYWPVRFSRWMTGLPDGPVVINGTEFFANVPVGCYMAGKNDTCL